MELELCRIGVCGRSEPQDRPVGMLLAEAQLDQRLQVRTAAMVSPSSPAKQLQPKITRAFSKSCSVAGLSVRTRSWCSISYDCLLTTYDSLNVHAAGFSDSVVPLASAREFGVRLAFFFDFFFFS